MNRRTDCYPNTTSMLGSGQAEKVAVSDRNPGGMLDEAVARLMSFVTDAHGNAYAMEQVAERMMGPIPADPPGVGAAADTTLDRLFATIDAMGDALRRQRLAIDRLERL